jgi:hypothetical protein
MADEMMPPSNVMVSNTTDEERRALEALALVECFAAVFFAGALFWAN